MKSSNTMQQSGDVFNGSYIILDEKTGICYSFIIIAVSIFLSFITKTYQYTYPHIGSGIIGWFSSANTISLILCALVPWVLYMSSNSKNIILYIISHIAIFIILYTN